jgi:hypothetical protein
MQTAILVLTALNFVALVTLKRRIAQALAECFALLETRLKANQ